ncbi:hypothetical protein GCK72_006338 [Caenorhabditis remanei]|uniref:DUF38 domain-containing protein n=1 Tax=Caenorhabditis remanei TaxID=31234 RepID=A0A6A5HH54_CAERE|nr:hypothetical protein GCK72_006338 [Caenorhabditis remanei]KAF1766381.1 hypothetical protein GCK72_006338 [Caenorhabditis remanei]
MPSPPTFPWASEQRNERLRRFYERHLEIYQIALARRPEGGQGFPFPMMTIVFTDDELIAMRGPIIQELTPEALELKLADLKEMSTCTLKTFITKLRYCLQPFDCRQNNKALPFIPLIQLTIQSEDGQEKRIERYPYTFKLHEAMRKLCGKLFGGRNSIVQVNKFSLNNINFVLRIPEGLNIRIRNLRLGEKRIKRLEALKNLIDESSYPLASLIIHGSCYEADHFAHSTLTSARQLILEGELPDDITDLLNLKNTAVCFKYSWSRDFSNEELLAFAENIVTEVFPIGTYRSFKIFQEERIKNLLNQVREKFNGRTKKSSASIAMGNGSKLRIFYKTDPRHQEHKKWLLIMKVVPA